MNARICNFIKSAKICKVVFGAYEYKNLQIHGSDGSCSMLCFVDAPLVKSNQPGQLHFKFTYKKKKNK